MADVDMKHTDERVTTVQMSWTEVCDVLGHAAEVLAEVQGDRTRKVTVRLKQLTEGSPEYSVDRWTACVTIVDSLGKPGDPRRT